MTAWDGSPEPQPQAPPTPGLKVGKREMGLGAPIPSSRPLKGTARDEAHPTSSGGCSDHTEGPASQHGAVWAQLP